MLRISESVAKERHQEQQYKDVEARAAWARARAEKISAMNSLQEVKSTIHLSRDFKPLKKIEELFPRISKCHSSDLIFDAS